VAYTNTELSALRCLQLQDLRRLYFKYFGRFTKDLCCLNQEG